MKEVYIHKCHKITQSFKWGIGNGGGGGLVRSFTKKYQQVLKFKCSSFCGAHIVLKKHNCRMPCSFISA